MSTPKNGAPRLPPQLVERLRAVRSVGAITGAGVYVLELSASDGELSASDTVTITVEPFSTRVTKTYRAVDDAFIEGSSGHNTGELKVEHDRQISYLKFTVTGPGFVAVPVRITQPGSPATGALLTRFVTSMAVTGLTGVSVVSIPFISQLTRE